MFYAVFLTQMKGGKQKLGKLDFDKAGAPLRRNGTKLQDDDATWGQEILNAPIKAAEAAASGVMKILPKEKEGRRSGGGGGGGSARPVRPEDYGDLVLIKLTRGTKTANGNGTSKNLRFHMCRVAHGAYRRDPVHLPFFSDLLSISGCERPSNLEVWDRAQAEEYLASHRVVPPSGFIFHAGRVGSTLAANMLAVDPGALVYSEAQPIVEASYSYCRNCDMDYRVDLFRLVVGLMGVSPDADRLFFKLHPTSTPEVELFHRAFPETPYIYLHRDPVEVMMSMLKTEYPAGSNNYLPLRSQRASKGRPKPRKQPPCLRPLVEVHKALGFGASEGSKRSPREEYCGAYLREINLAAARHATGEEHGMPVNYDRNYVDKMKNIVIPKFFKVPQTDEYVKRVKEVSSVYSKQRGKKKQNGKYEADIDKKQKEAWPYLREMSNKWVTPSYDKLVKIENMKLKELESVEIIR